MKCLENLNRNVIANNLLTTLTNIYTFKGKDFFYKEILKSDLDLIIKQTIEKDTFFLSKILDLNISEQRMKLLLKKKSLPKNTTEERIVNFQLMFSKIQKNHNNFELLVNEISSLHKLLYSKNKQTYVIFAKTTKKELDAKICSKINSSKRELLEELTYKYNKELERKEYELTLLITNFYVDFINIAPFTKNNEIVGLLLLYTLLFRENFDVFKYVSFFELVYLNKDDLKKSTIQASFNWEDGYSQIMPFYKYILEFLKKGYLKAEEIVDDHEFDKGLNKTDNIEYTILKMPEIFTKDDVRNAHPYVSDSTINRTLKRLRDENKIRPIGKGRSAKWIKLEVENKQMKMNFRENI